MPSGQKRNSSNANYSQDSVPQISVPKKFKQDEKKLIVVLENAQLEVAQVGKKSELLASDKHVSFLKSHRKDPADYRPDITHQCLLMLLDSPLNRSGRLQVYIHTVKNVLIYVNPQTRIPRTFDRFAGLMVELLKKLKIRATVGSEMLLKVVKGPVERILPSGCRKFCMSLQGKVSKQPRDIADASGAEEPIVAVIGAMARGSVNVSYTEELIRISDCPLSAALTCAKITSGFEETWGIF